MILPEHLPQGILTGKDSPVTVPDQPQDLNAIKKQRLIQALKTSNGNRSEAARILGISRTSVWNQIKRYGLTT
jgi:transcriptional regulator of acetoin/glycerol metabolism